MSFKNIPNIEVEYRNQIDDVVNEFYLPVLSQAVTYKRAVGYFSSEILVRISKGIGQLIKNGGTIQLLISPKLSVEDLKTIEKAKDSFVSKHSIDQLEDLIDKESQDRLSLLYFLLSSKKLTIKFAIVKDQKYGIYHEKLGLLKDDEGNIVAFTGSANETGAAIDYNYESIDVYQSWKNDSDFERCNIKEMAFERLWSNEDKAIETIELSDVISKKLLKYKNDDQSYVLDIDNYYLKKQNKKNTYPENPVGKSFFDYQITAINNWKLNNYIGIYDMATGTGKTFTALGSIVQLFKDKKRIFVIIIVPYIHLVDQWNEEANDFNIFPTLIYSENSQWKDTIKRKISWFQLKQSNFECLITTNASFTNLFLQQQLELVKNELLIIVDEAHNIGAQKLSSSLNNEIKYRLALSATIDRHNDAIGTQKIYDYFNKKVISIDLAQAIQKGFLTPYEYYPVIVYLTDEERLKYYDISYKIIKILGSKDYDKLSYDEKELIKILSLRRARVVAGALNKIEKLSEIISKTYKNDHNMLIYCGAVIYKENTSENDYSEDIRQLDLVIKELGINQGMVVSRFTSLESKDQRKDIKKSFIEGDLQALVAIKCLDEGVNIPAIKTAFILASSNNPREYIQRRGRVLRRFPGKQISRIYDFITIASPFEEVSMLDQKTKKIEASLAIKELKRIIDFSQISNNPTFSNDIIELIETSYDLNRIRIDETEEILYE